MTDTNTKKLSDSGLLKRSLRSNPEYRAKEERRRVMLRLSKGIKIHEDTLKKHNITQEEISNTTGVNKDVVLDGIKSSGAIKPVTDKYSKLTMDTITVFINQFEPYSNHTKITRIHQLKKFLTSENVLTDLRNWKELTKRIDDSSDKVETHKSHYSAVIWLINTYPNLKNKINKQAREAYTAKFKSATNKSQAEMVENTSDIAKSVVMFSEIYDKAIAKYGNNSIEHLYFEIYNNAILRDDLGNVKLIKYKKEATSSTSNYLWLKAAGPVLILGEYKTRSNYGVQELQLPKSINHILKALNKSAGDWLFARQTDISKPYGQMSTLVGDMLDDMGIPRGDKSIIYLRHSKISEELQHIKNTDERVKLAQKAMHSPCMSSLYIRSIIKSEINQATQ
jgi:hypothetical protein